jgi:hypothetical protein
MKRGTKVFISGLILTIVGAFLVPYMMIMPLFKAEYPEFKFKNPGKDNISLTEPGKYYLWNDYQTVYEGKVYNTSKQLPNGTTVKIFDLNSGKELKFNSDSSISVSMGNDAQNSIGYVEISGPQTLDIQIESGEERVFTFAQSRFMKILKSITGAIVLTAVLTVSGIIFIIWGIIRMTSKDPNTE